MFLPLVVLALGAFSTPRPWALGFAASPRIPLVGDVNNDGDSDLVCVYPAGNCIIDYAPTVDGVKCGSGSQAATQWGTDCQAAAIGDFDSVPGADVVGLFAGDTLRLAGAFANGKFKDTPSWVRLPKKLKVGHLTSLGNGKSLLAFDETGTAFSVDSASRTVTTLRVPSGLVWIGDAGEKLVCQDRRGTVQWMDRLSYRTLGKLGQIDPLSRPAAAPGYVVFGHQVWTPTGLTSFNDTGLPQVPTTLWLGSLGKDKVPVVFGFRYGNELHTANQVWMSVIGGDAGSASVHRLTDSSHDGLLDDWKTNGYRGLDLKGLGCKVGQADVVCLISRFDDVSEARVKSELERVRKFYADLPCKNPDGSTGVHVHFQYTDVVTGANKSNPWWVNRDKYRPEKWRGVVHWMQITGGGGGQADELGDGGTCGEGALWAVFAHEFGHQLSLNHEGFWQPGSCPIYTSLMNYNYSYSFEDSRDKIHFSDGSLSKLVLRETDLDEMLPYPYEKVSFLEKGPYHFKLKKDGNKTLIDWNWNGIFGEKHVRADINYAYGIGGGERQTVTKTKTAPFLFEFKGRPTLLNGYDDRRVDAAVDPTLSSERTGYLELRRMVGPKTWSDPVQIESGGLAGDPVAVEFRGQAYTFYQTKAGVVLRKLAFKGENWTMSPPELVAAGDVVPTVAKHQGSLYLFLWDATTSTVRYRVYRPDGTVGKELKLSASSTNPVGLCTDTKTGEAVLAIGQNQDNDKPYRWQIRRYTTDANGRLVGGGTPNWVEGEQGGARGTGRLTVLFDGGPQSGPHGRIYLIAKGMTGGKDAPWACGYIAQQIADKTHNGGWIVKRYYDEWTQTRSAPSALWFSGDVIYAYRWVDGAQGETDNNLHVAYQGLGITPEPFGDHDDISLIRNFGLQHSLLALGADGQ